ncbi:unnamed protein product, partial [Closterium sp. Naga37s-1]
MSRSRSAPLCSPHPPPFSSPFPPLSSSFPPALPSPTGPPARSHEGIRAAGAGRAGHGAVRAASRHEGIRAAGAGRTRHGAVRASGGGSLFPTPFPFPPPSPASLHPAMKAFELLGLGAQDTVQYARVGEVGGDSAGDGAGDNDHDLDPLDHDSHNHVASSPLSPSTLPLPPTAMKAFELLGLGAQDTVQYARVGEVGGDGAGDNDHDLDPLDHDSHNHAGGGARGSPQLGASARGSPPPRKQQQQQQQRVPGVVFKTEAARAAAAALDEEMAGGGDGGGGGGGGGRGGGNGVGEVRRPRQAAAAPLCSKATCLWVLVSLALSITLTQVGGWVDGWVGGWMGGWVDEGVGTFDVNHLLMGMCGYNLRFKGAWVTLVYDPSTRAQTTESVASLEHSVYDESGVFQVTFDTLEEEIREIRDQLNGNQKTGAKPAAP